MTRFGDFFGYMSGTFLVIWLMKAGYGPWQWLVESPPSTILGFAIVFSVAMIAVRIVDSATSVKR